MWFVEKGVQMKTTVRVVIAIVVSVSAVLLILSFHSFASDSATEAPAGFDNQTNGLVDQLTFDSDRQAFEERETVEDGLGPVYNATSCADCHANPVTGAGSQITELRAGNTFQGQFTEHPGGSLIQDRAIDPSIQERILPGNNTRALRMSLNTRGDGFVEAIADSTLISIANNQPVQMRGLVTYVRVLEARGAYRVGRFGWKNQHASLVSFSADAYLNEMGITSLLQPAENTSNGNSVAAFDAVADPEDHENDVSKFAGFIRATKVPPRDEDLAS
jgi:hypothetical protein